MTIDGTLTKPFHLIMVPLLPPIQLYASNTSRLSLTHSLMTAIAFVIGFMSLRFAVNKLLNDKKRNDILLSLGFIAVFYGIFYNLMYPYIFLWVGFFSIIIGYISLQKTVRRSATIYINIIVLSMLIRPLATIFEPSQWEQRDEILRQIENNYRALPTTTSSSIKSNRDFYYIIMDRYARADQLASIYGYDNTSFIQALESRGFQIASNSYSNYQRTAHSVASSMNLSYLNNLDQVPGANSHDWIPLYELLRNSRLIKFMKLAGFELHAYGSWWEPTRSIPRAEKVSNFYAWPEMLRVIFENSLLGKAAYFLKIKPLQSLWLQCNRPHHKFARMIERANSNRRKFVFAHFLIPHPPYVLDENGECMSISKARSRTRAENYIGQLKYANKELLKLIDHLQAAKGPKPVIVLQADEGPWPVKYAGDEIGFLGRDVTSINWLKASPVELREKMGILNAQYLPDIEGLEIADNTTPVNTFRRILKHYFDVPINELSDLNYIYESNARMYHFHDVTALLNQP